MRKIIVDYLNTERVGVLAVEMPDGSPHAAAIHFAYCNAPVTFFFETRSIYRKAEAFKDGKKSRASFVVGCDDNVMKTMQLDGIVEVLNDNDQELFDSVYFEKFPEKMKKEKDDTTVYFKFTPTWWRYTDWKHSDGKFVIHSENIDVLDEKGNKTGEVRSIDDIHFYGFWHSSARVWIMNSKGEILLQHRDKSHVEFPDKWDVSAAGHITAGHDSIGTAVSEVKEELGIDIESSDLKLIKRMVKSVTSNDGKYIDNSFEDIYLVNKDIHIDDFLMQKIEVQNLKWVSVEDFRKMVSDPNSELVPHAEEYEMLLGVIGK
jgi:isopentenyldiphosphate isomerase/general stress protein 26